MASMGRLPLRESRTDKASRCIEAFLSSENPSVLFLEGLELAFDKARRCIYTFFSSKNLNHTLHIFQVKHKSLYLKFSN